MENQEKKVKKHKSIEEIIESNKTEIIKSTLPNETKIGDSDEINVSFATIQLAPSINYDIVYYALQNMLKDYKCGNNNIPNEIVFRWYKDNINSIPIAIRNKIAMELEGYLFNNPNLMGCAIGNINDLIKTLK